MPFSALYVAPCTTWDTEQEEETEVPEYGLDNEICDAHEYSSLIIWDWYALYKHAEAQKPNLEARIQLKCASQVFRNRPNLNRDY